MSPPTAVQTIRYINEDDSPIETIEKTITMESDDICETLDPGTRAAALSILNRAGVEGVPKIIELKTEIGEDGSQTRTATIEKIQGGNLHEKYENNPATPKETVEILLQLATICTNMLDWGVYHNDIKPSNIMINEKGKITLVDFDSATIVGNENRKKKDYYKGLAHMCTDDSALGTKVLMPPERVNTEDKYHTIDGRSEVYSMCATGLLLLTGIKKPEEGETLSMIALRMINQQTTKIHREIYELLYKNLEEDPEKRTSATIQDFKEQLKLLHNKIVYNNNNAT